MHEVGHTQAIRPTCTPIFEGAPSSGGDHEMWATAWAIGMGYDLPGAGIEAYGPPTDAQIAAAAPVPVSGAERRLTTGIARPRTR